MSSAGEEGLIDWIPNHLYRGELSDLGGLLSSTPFVPDVVRVTPCEVQAPHISPRTSCGNEQQADRS